MRQVVRIAVLLVTTMILSQVAVAHDGRPHDFDDLWHTWSFDPLVVLSLVVSAAIYSFGLLRVWKNTGLGRAINGWEVAAFLVGWLSLAVALISPLHPWGEVLFSAHMTQHEILMLVSAPLLVLSRPVVATLWAMPVAWRGPTRTLVKSRSIASAWRLVTYPLAAWAIHFVALWIWHIPALFQATLESDLVHTLQHASFFGSALLFWWAVIGGRHGAASYGAGILYLFTTSIHSGILGAFLTFTSRVWYPIYSRSTEWGLTPIEDQQLGGLIMWVPAGLIYIVAALFMFAGWLRESEKRVRLRERVWMDAAGEI